MAEPPAGAVVMDGALAVKVQEAGLEQPVRLDGPVVEVGASAIEQRGLPEAAEGLPTSVTFVVVGRPAPKGSKSWKGITKSGRPRMVEASQLLPAWMSAVTYAALELRRPPFPGAVGASIVFRFQRPPSHYGKRGLKPSAPEYPVGPPDVDKLMRAVFDALQQAGLLPNDSRVVLSNEAKVYCREGEPSGAVITLMDLSRKK